MPTTDAPKKKPWLKQQPMMRKVEYALMPALLGAIYFFGWRSLAMVLWVALVGIATEYMMSKKRGDQVSEAVFVTALLLGLSMPPTIPFWQAGVGMFVAILFGKEVFGGFPRNVFNPAIVGRGFLYVCFPTDLTNQFTPVWKSLPGGFAHWGATKVIDGVDAVSSATPMWSRRDFGYEASLWDLITGNIGELFTGADGVQRALVAGSVGEVSALLLLLGAAYLIVRGYVRWYVPVLYIGTVAALVAVLPISVAGSADGETSLVWAAAFRSDALGQFVGYHVLCGGLMLGALYMATDMVTSPLTGRGHVIFAIGCGVLTVLIRLYGGYPEGVCYSILLMNTTVPLIDRWTRPRVFGAVPKKKEDAA